MKNSKTKIVSILCGLTILSACGTDDWKSEKVTSPRHAPAVNAAPTAQNDSSGYVPMPPMPVMPPAPIPQTPQGNAPGMLSSSGQVSPPLYAPVPPAPPMAPPMAPQMQANAAPAQQLPLPSDRRPPQFNREAMGTSNESISPVPPPQVSQVRLPAAGAVPVIPPPPTDSQIAASTSQPMPPSLPQRAPGYPNLTEVPPSPKAPIPADNDARVQQMKQDLSDIQQQKALQQGQPAPQPIIVRSVATGGGPTPNIQQLSNTPQSNNKTIASSQAPLPGAYSPVPPAPPLSPAPAYALPAPTYNPQMAANAAPAPTPIPYTPPTSTPNQGLMPNGPTVVVHSNHASTTPYAPPPPPMPQAPAMATLPPPNPGVRNMAALPPAPPPPPAEVPMAYPAPRVASNSLPPQPLPPAMHTQTATTSVSSLHPIPVQPVGPGVSYAAADSSQTGAYTNPNSLQPIASSGNSNGYRLLPDSRYAKYRQASNNSFYNSNDQ